MVCPNCKEFVSWRYKRCPCCATLIPQPALLAGQHPRTAAATLPRAPDEPNSAAGAVDILDGNGGDQHG